VPAGGEHHGSLLRRPAERLAALIVSSVLAAPGVSLTLQTWMSKLLGPLLVLVGMVMLDLLRLPVGRRARGAAVAQAATRLGAGGAVLLGALLALSFCPVSAALFFGSLLPLAVRQESVVLLPLLYGIGTALPVIAFSFVLAFGVRFLGRAFDRVREAERLLRRLTGLVFVGAGVYMSLAYVYGVL